MFSGCTVLPESKDSELGTGHQETSPSAGSVVVCHFMHGSVSAIFSHTDIPEVPACHLFSVCHEFSVSVTKITSRIDVSLTDSLAFWFLPPF